MGDKTLKRIFELESSLTRMFDSDVRVGLALLEEVRGLKKEYKKNIEELIDAQSQLIEVLYIQMIDLSLMSKIELDDDVIAEIKRLKELINQNKGENL